VIAGFAMLVSQGGSWTTARLGLLLILLLPSAARADQVESASAPSTEQCIEHHVAGQALRVDGLFSRAAERLRQCLHDACSPVLRADCASVLDAVERETPTLVLALDVAGTDVVDASMYVDGKLVASRLDGRPIPFDAGPHELRFEVAGFSPATRSVVVRAGEKNRLVTVVLERPATALTEPSHVHVPTVQAAVPRDMEARRGLWLRDRIRRADVIAFGSSVALLSAGAGVGLSALRDTRRAEDECGSACPRARSAPIERKALAADILLLSSAATFLYVAVRVAVRRPTAASARVLVGPSCVGAHVSF
jgi:hypothetical protein